MCGSIDLTRWIPTGSNILDRLLEGGLPPSINLIYGEAETGKSTLAMQCALNCARLGLKTLYVDSDGTFSLERLFQIASQDLKEVSDLIILLKPSTFSEQAEIVDGLERYVNRRFGLIVFDTITSLYRLEIVGRKETFHLNRELNRQVAMLGQIAKSFNLSVLLISQVRSIYWLDRGDIAPVATRVLKFWSDSVLCLHRTEQRNVIGASLEKKGGKEANLTFKLVIKEDGIHDYIS